MRIYKTRGFTRFAKSERLTDGQLKAAVANAENGLIEAELGSGVIKLRIARPGPGKSGGFRTLIAYRAKTRAVFMYGFAKNQRAIIQPKELETLKLAAADILASSQEVIATMVKDGKLLEVGDGCKENE